MRGALSPRLAAAFLAVAAGAPARAEAAQSCAIVGTVGVRFGTYDTHANEPLDSTGRVLFVCHGVTASDTIRIQLSHGIGAAGGGSTDRAMAFGGAPLAYGLYLDAARTIPWGDGSGSSSLYAGLPPEGTTVSIDIYGRIPPRQNVSAGAYADVIVVTVIY